MMYVTTSLEIQLKTSQCIYCDLYRISDRVYRILDLPYYCWINNKIKKAKQAAEQGQLNPNNYQTLLARFKHIHHFAVQLFGADQLKAALNDFTPDDFEPPTADNFRRLLNQRRDGDSPPSPIQTKPIDAREEDIKATQEAIDKLLQAKPQQCRHKVQSHALEVIQAVEGRAIAKGWTPAELYNYSAPHPYPYDDSYGVINGIHQGDRIGEITSGYIEIIKKSGSVLRHYKDHTARETRIVFNQRQEDRYVQSA